MLTNKNIHKVFIQTSYKLYGKAGGFIRDDDRNELDSAFRQAFWIRRWGLERIEYDSDYNIYYWGLDKTQRGRRQVRGDGPRQSREAQAIIWSSGAVRGRPSTPPRKVQVEKLLADDSRMKGYDAGIKPFLDELFIKGLIPRLLIRWEMTGLDDEIARLSSRPAGPGRSLSSNSET